jgi:hypothetical protein
MRSAATLIASLLSSDTTDQILQLTGGHHLTMRDDDLRTVENAELPAIARLLPANAACQIVRVASRLKTDTAEVTAEVANAVSNAAALPKRAAARGPQNAPGQRPIIRTDTNPARLAALASQIRPLRSRTGRPARIRDLPFRRPLAR